MYCVVYCVPFRPRHLLVSIFSVFARLNFLTNAGTAAASVDFMTALKLLLLTTNLHRENGATEHVGVLVGGWNVV